jgi:histidinol-phosphate aminotransferase
MEFLSSEFDKLGLAYVPSHGNFILVRVGNGNEVFQRLLTQGVIVRPVGAYEFPEHVRVTVGKMDENHRFIEALRGIMKTA